MNILFINSFGDWHIDLWVKYFTESHSVYLFSDKDNHLTKQPFSDVKIISSAGYLGNILNITKSKSHLLYQINKLFSTRYFAKKIDKAINKYDINIVHAHSLYYGFLASFIKSKIPIVFTPMGSDVIIHAQKNKLYRYMAKKAFDRVDIITGDSLLLQRQGYKVGARNENNYIIQNGVDSEVFKPKSNDLKKKYGILEDEILLFSPRAISLIYNIDVIIDSISHLKNAGYKVKCMFSFPFGSKYLKKYKAQISKLGIEENVIFLDFLTYENMAMHYNAADIILSVPSSDSSPKSVYEAMFCKKPIIISDLEWSYEILSESECLLRVDARNPIQLSDAIKMIIENSAYADRLAKKALDTAHKYFNYRDNMKKMETIMLETVENI